MKNGSQSEVPLFLSSPPSSFDIPLVRIKWKPYKEKQEGCQDM